LITLFECTLDLIGGYRINGFSKLFQNLSKFSVLEYN
jgi:hypothetical protein